MCVFLLYFACCVYSQGKKLEGWGMWFSDWISSREAFRVSVGDELAQRHSLKLTARDSAPLICWVGLVVVDLVNRQGAVENV